jgi:hypothetical protein
MLKLITAIHPAPAGFLDAVNRKNSDRRYRGALRRVARIIAVRRACSKCWLHFAQQTDRLVHIELRMAIIHSAPAISVGSFCDQWMILPLFHQEIAPDCVVPLPAR